MRKLWEIGMVCLILTTGCSPKTNTEEQEQTALKRPNIVYIMCDDLAYQAISAYGGIVTDIAPTPNIDRIAKGGAIFDQNFCTNSICGPSRACILTGKMSHINGFFKNVDGGDFNTDQFTFPEAFQENGYQTAVVGKWHLGCVPQGFDYSKVLINHGGQGTYYHGQYVINGQDTVTEPKRHSTRVAQEDALAWLNQRDKEKPFLLLYQFKAPHRPWRPDSLYQHLFADVEIPYPSTFNDDYEGRKAAADQLMMIESNLNRRDLKQIPPKGLTKKEEKQWLDTGNGNEFWTPHDTLQGEALKKWKYQTYVKDYLRCVHGVDKAVGAMLDYLESEGIAENTIVVFTSDQGFYLGEHGWFDKRFMYEESFKMPLLIKYPKVIAPGTRIDQLTANIDFAPTLMDFAGIPAHDAFQGESMKPYLTGVSDQGREAIYYHYYEWPIWHRVQPHYGVRTDRYKLIHFYYNMDEWELYDLKSDPEELNNLYGKEEYQELVAILKKELKAQQEHYSDTISLEDMRKMTDVKIERSYIED